MKRGTKGEELDEQVDTVVQPDVLVVCDAGKLDRRGVRGAPDFVVEVLSPATASHDYLFKRHAYERAGVREYWLVHPADRMLTSYRLVDGRYGEPAMQELAGSTPVSVCYRGGDRVGPSGLAPAQTRSLRFNIGVGSGQKWNNAMAGDAQYDGFLGIRRRMGDVR